MTKECLNKNADAARTNRIDEELTLPLVKLWSVKIIEEVSPPVVSNGVVYIRTYQMNKNSDWINHQIEAYDLYTGEQKWVYKPEVNKRHGMVLCASGDMVISYDDSCYYGVSDGQVQWKAKKARDDYRKEGWPAVHRGMLVINTSWWNLSPWKLIGGEIQVVDPADGRVVRSASIDEPLAPACYEDYIVVVDRANRSNWKVVCFDFNTLNKIWTWESNKEGAGWGMPTIKDNKVYVVIMNELFCLDLMTGIKQWEAKVKSGFPSCTSNKIVSTEVSSFRCFDPDSGDLIYEKKEEELSYFDPAPSLSIGKHLLLSGKRLLILNEDTGEPEQIFKPNLGSFVRNIVYAEGRVLFCKFRGHLYCLGPKELKPKKVKGGG